MNDWNIQHVVVMGAGAVGGYFGGMIDKHTDRRVYYIARGSHLESMLMHGLQIESEHDSFRLQVTASDDPRSVDVADLILLTVKSHDTPEAIKRFKPIVTQNTQVLTLQNGIENYPQLVEVFGRDRVIQGFCRIGASVPEPGVIAHSNMGSITIGDPKNETMDQRHREVCNLFADAGIECQFSNNIKHDIWVKFAWNCIFNMLTTVAFVTVDSLYEEEEAEQLCYDLFDEISELARFEQVELTEEDKHRIIDGARDLVDFKTSTYQDREKGKSLEFEAFTGTVVRLARKYGVEVPRHETLYALLKLIDQNENRT